MTIRAAVASVVVLAVLAMQENKTPSLPPGPAASSPPPATVAAAVPFFTTADAMFPTGSARLRGCVAKYADFLPAAMAALEARLRLISDFNAGISGHGEAGSGTGTGGIGGDQQPQDQQGKQKQRRRQHRGSRGREKRAGERIERSLRRRMRHTGPLWHANVRALEVLLAPPAHARPAIAPLAEPHPSDERSDDDEYDKSLTVTGSGAAGNMDFLKKLTKKYLQK